MISTMEADEDRPEAAEVVSGTDAEVGKPNAKKSESRTLSTKPYFWASSSRLN